MNGRDVVLYKKISDVYYQVACAESITLSFTNDIIRRSTITSGLFPSRRVRRSDISGSCSGVTKLTNAGGISIFHFLEEGVRRAEGDFKFYFTDDDGNEQEVVITALVEAINITSATTDLSSFDLSIVVTGGFEMNPVADPTSSISQIMSDWWETTEGQYTVSGNSQGGYSIVGKTVVEVDREGTQYDLVTGTPGNRECKYNSLAGSIEFQSTSPFTADERIFVIWY